jgi:uncharacterized membrane protein YhaH (DUF805 family)
MSASFLRSSKGQLLFSFQGRIPRTDFWVGLTAIVGITTLAILLGGQRPNVRGLGEFFAVVMLIALLSPFCLGAITVKRLHDLGRSGWLALPLLVLPLLFAMLAVMAASGLNEGRVMEEWQRCWTMVFYTSAALAAALFTYLIVRLGFSRGTPGANQFGPDPLALQEESVDQEIVT